MDLFVTAKPHLILETTELLYAYVNDIPPQELTHQGAYCLPVEAVREILETACADVSKTDAALRYYFGKQVLFEDPMQTTCIARNLLYNIQTISAGPIAADFETLRQVWMEQTALRWRLTGINKYTLSYGDPDNDQYVPIAYDVGKLGVSPEYGQMLLEQLSGCTAAIDRLEKIITPVALKLQPLLEPWAERAEPLARAWEEYYRLPDAESQLRQRIRYTLSGKLKALHVQLRYLGPRVGPGNVWTGKDCIYLHTGVAITVEKPTGRRFDALEFQALRLLGSESRMQMLRVMLDKPMSSRELAKALNLHLGVVTRDISNLYDVGLLIQESTSRHCRYRTNMETLQTIIRHLTELDQYTFPQMDNI